MRFAMPALGLKNLEYRAELALPYTRWDLLQSNYRRTVFHWSQLSHHFTATSLNFLTSAVDIITPSAIWP